MSCVGGWGRRPFFLSFSFFHGGFLAATMKAYCFNHSKARDGKLLGGLAPLCA